MSHTAHRSPRLARYGWGDTGVRMGILQTTLVTTTLALAPFAASAQEPTKRFGEAATVLAEVMAAPDKGIPLDLLERAHCVVIVPDLETAALVVGGKVWQGLPLLPHQDGRLVGALDRVHRGRQHRLSDRQLVDGPQHAGDERARSGQAAGEQVHARRGGLGGRRSGGAHGDGADRRPDARVRSVDAYLVSTSSKRRRPSADARRRDRCPGSRASVADRMIRGDLVDSTVPTPSTKDHRSRT